MEPEETQVEVLSEEELRQKAAKDLAKVQKMEVQLSELEMVLAGDERFQNFLRLQKAVNDKSAEVKKSLEKQMIENNIKSITLDSWGKITIVERKDIKVVNVNKVPKKFLKYVVSGEEIKAIEDRLGRKVEIESKEADLPSIKDHAKLSGKVPKGAEEKVTQFIKMTPKKEEK
jgi:hypothetical protein